MLPGLAKESLKQLFQEGPGVKVVEEHPFLFPVCLSSAPHPCNT